MKKILLTLLALSFSGFAGAATLKIATVTPEGSQWMKDMRASAKEIKELTTGGAWPSPEIEREPIPMMDGYHGQRVLWLIQARARRASGVL